MKRLFGLQTAALLMAVATCGRADILTNPPGQLNPVSGDLAGFDGTTVTWGISLYNNTGDPNATDPNLVNPAWWVITGVSADYTSTGAPGEIPDGPNYFTDLLSTYFFNNFFLNGTALAPGQDLNLGSPGSPVDLGSFAISPTADPGTIPAQLHISIDVWDANPFDPNNTSAVQLPSFQLDVDTSVTALGPLVATPEPGPLWQAIGIGLVLAGARFRRKNTEKHG